jgi:transposase-like protein
MSGKRISAAQKEDIIRDIRAKKQSYHSISKKHSISVSTVSRLANEIGLGRPQKKTKPGDTPEHSYDRTKRISALDRMLNSIDKMVEAGGLSTSQLKDLASAASSVFSTRRAEDIEPVEEEKDNWIVWDPALKDDDPESGSTGIGYDLNTEIGRRMYAFSQAVDSGLDFEQAKAREQAIMEEMKAKAAEAEGQDDG